jgi:hypothetical protein
VRIPTSPSLYASFANEAHLAKNQLVAVEAMRLAPFT